MKSNQRRVTLPWIQWGIRVFLENNGNIRRWIRPLKALSKNFRRDSKCKNGREARVWLPRLNLKPTKVGESYRGQKEQKNSILSLNQVEIRQ